MAKTQLDILLERREEVLKMILDSTVSREDFLKFFNVSTKALYAFMSVEKVSWVRKPHDGTNQHTDELNKKIEKIRIKVDNNESIDDLFFRDDPELLLQTGVYRILSSSGGVYIGMASVSFKKRFKTHKRMLNENRHHCKGLQRSFNKDPNCFFEIVEVIEDKDKIPQRELDHWKSYNDKNVKLYNGEPGGDRFTVYHTEETKQRLSEIAKARSAVFTEQQIKDIYQEICVEGRSINSLKKRLKCSDKKIKDYIAENGWDYSHEARIRLHMEEILASGRNGEAYRDVSRRLNIPRDMIHEIFKSNGIIYTTGELTEKEKQIALDMYSKEGKSIKSVSQIMKISYSRLQSYLNSINAEKGIEGVWRRDKVTGEIIVNPDLLKDLINNEKLSVREISEKLDIDMRVVNNSLSKI